MIETFPFQRESDRFRIVLGLEYQGTGYRGWQVQKSGVPTIQAALERAISKIADEPIATIVAGRTDAGVHATNQIVHFDTQALRDPYGWMMGINGVLPDDISVRWAKPVDESFHARFSAVERSYRFIIHNSWVKSALLANSTTWERFELDANQMQKGADFLLGQHDFSSFRAAECQAHSPVRTLRELKVQRFGEFVVLQARADGFLHHMVRNLVGVLLPIGRGRKPPEYAQQVLSYADRTKGGVTAKGDGLYFVKAHYEVGDLPQKPAGPSFLQPLIDTLPNKFDVI